MAENSTFVWGAGGRKLSPEEVASYRNMASALGQKRVNSTPQNGWEGLSAVANALSERLWRDEASKAESQGRDAATALLQGIGSGSSSDAIISALTSPDASWLSPTQSSIASALLGNQLERSDPRYQQQLALGDQQLQMGQAELDAMLNPPPAAHDYGFTFAPDGTLIRTDTTAGAFQPMGSFPKPETGPLVTVNNGGEGTDIGTIPPGYAAVADPSNPAGFRFEAIPGGPVAAEQAAAANAETAASGNRDIATSVITNAASNARAAFESGALTTGIPGNVAALDPSSQAAELRRQVDVLKANASIENLQAMREASPTGGALGSVTERENAMLASKSGALDPSSPNFMSALDDYERTLLEIVHGPEAGRRIYEETRRSANDSGIDPKFSAATPPAGWRGDPELWQWMSPEARSLW